MSSRLPGAVCMPACGLLVWGSNPNPTNPKPNPRGVRVAYLHRMVARMKKSKALVSTNQMQPRLGRVEGRMQLRDRPSYTRPSCLPSRLPTTAAGGRSPHSSCSSPGLSCFCGSLRSSMDADEIASMRAFRAGDGPLVGVTE